MLIKIRVKHCNLFSFKWCWIPCNETTDTFPRWCINISDFEMCLICIQPRCVMSMSFFIRTIYCLSFRRLIIYLFSFQEKIAIGLVACIFVLCVIVIVFIAIFIFRVGIKPKLKALKIHDFNIKVSTNLPTRSDNITKERFNGHLSFLKTDCSNTLPYETGC